MKCAQTKKQNHQNHTPSRTEEVHGVNFTIMSFQPVHTCKSLNGRLMNSVHIGMSVVSIDTIKANFGKQCADTQFQLTNISRLHFSRENLCCYIFCLVKMSFPNQCRTHLLQHHVTSASQTALQKQCRSASQTAAL